MNVQYELSLENDTLWYDTETGKLAFAPRYGLSGSLINLRAFVFPFTFPKDDFPQGQDITDPIQLFGKEQVYAPSPDWVDMWEFLGAWVYNGSLSENDAYLIDGKGMAGFYYFNGEYNRPSKDQSGDLIVPDDTMIREVYYECRLVP